MFYVIYFLFGKATARIDSATDRKIQEVIRTVFEKQTTLIIAHRLESLLGCDRIMVVDGGKVVEMGPPRVVLADPTSLFSIMMTDAL
jgi:ABC-type multidrug transport system fused ATPase/permease subunit